MEWTEADMPWFEIDNFVDILIDKVNILDILNHWGVDVCSCQSGDFSHRLKCPLPVHMSGGERTASFFVSQTQNKFYCFGCNSQGSVIDLVSLYYGKPFYEAVRWLSSYAGITKDNLSNCTDTHPKQKKDPEKSILTYVYKTGVVIRDHIKGMKEKKDYQKWCEWADRRFARLDKFVDELDDEDWEIAKKYYNKTVNYLKGDKS